MDPETARTWLVSQGHQVADVERLSDHVVVGICLSAELRARASRIACCPYCGSPAYDIGAGIAQCEQGCSSFTVGRTP
jgi:hypothetical protein